MGRSRTTELEPAVKGDANDYRLIELSGISTITGATIEGHVWRSGVTSTNLVVSIVNSGDTLTDPDDKPIIRVELGTWLQTDVLAGYTYMVEYEVTLPGGEVLTWPSGDPDQIYVREGK